MEETHQANIEEEKIEEKKDIVNAGKRIEKPGRWRLLVFGLCLFVCLVTVPMGACTGWVKGMGHFRGEQQMRRIVVSPISVCYTDNNGASSKCVYEGGICPLNETYCDALQNSTVNVGLMWGVFAFELVQFVYVLAVDKVKGCNFTVYAAFIPITLFAMFVVQMVASTKEEGIMDHFYHSSRLTNTSTDTGRVCAFLSVFLLCGQMIGFPLLCKYQYKAVSEDNNAKSQVTEDTPLIPTTDGETTSSNETPSGQQSSSDPPPYQQNADETVLYVQSVEEVPPTYQP